MMEDCKKYDPPLTAEEFYESRQELHLYSLDSHMEMAGAFQLARAYALYRLEHSRLHTSKILESQFKSSCNLTEQVKK